METVKTPNKKLLWTGRIISGICVLFLLMDAGMKIAKAALAMDGSVELGWPQDAVQGIGIVLLVCTILYAIPRTAIIGAILLTGFLGGAASIMFRAAVPGHPFMFPIVLGVLLWVGLGLQREKLRAVLFS